MTKALQQNIMLLNTNDSTKSCICVKGEEQNCHFLLRVVLEDDHLHFFPLTQHGCKFVSNYDVYTVPRRVTDAF